MYCYNCMNEINNGNVCEYCADSGDICIMPHHLKPGQILNNKYLVGRCIGEGGFGITYIGRDLVLDIRVAIKEFYPNGYANRNNAVTQNVTSTSNEHQTFFARGKERFLHEAKNIAKFVGEPGIVGVREYFEANNTAYIIMEYLDGINLSRYIKKNGKMPVNRVFELMMPIMHSLIRVHDSGIIHRDISPDNIMLMKNGTLKLMDFGSARYFANEEKEMSIMLKQGYAPEEQYRQNGYQGPWTDVYALCATIYRCITGIVPIDALDRMHRDTLKRPSQLGVQISPALETVLMYGLSVSIENRYKDLRELRLGVEKALRGENLKPDRQQAAAASVVQNMPQQVSAQRVSSVPYNQNNIRKTIEPVNRQAPIQPQSTKESKGSVAAVFGIIVIIITLALLGVLFYYFVMPMLTENKEKIDTPKKTDISVVSTQEPTEDDRIEVPDVAGKSIDKATEELVDKGLNVSPVYIYSEDVEENHVIRQLPTAGTKLVYGDEVKLYVSTPSTSDTRDDTDYYEDISVDEMTSDDISQEVNRIIGYYNANKDIEWSFVPSGSPNLNNKPLYYERSYMFYKGQLVYGVVYNDEETHEYYFKNDKLIRYIDPEGKRYDRFEFTNNRFLDEELIVTESYSALYGYN